VSERAEALWGRPIGSEELTVDLLPEPEAPWSELVFFASTLNGYEVAGPTPAELLAFADPIARRWRERRELPSDVTALRVALFAEQRRDHFSDSASDPSTMRYIHALVEAIRAQLLAAADPGGPASGPTDPPP
jgi:hypothetical protein